MNSQVKNKWFFDDVPALLKITQIFIKGDSFVLLPFLVLLVFLGLMNRELAIIVFVVFFSLRQIGEMFYWLMQQFSNTGYRPYDFGFKNLNNKAIYVIYQLINLVGATVGVSLLVYILFFV